MNVKHATLCCLLLAVMLHADQITADSCSYEYLSVPFCKSWMCKTQCWIESQLITSNTLREIQVYERRIQWLVSMSFL
ncbi:hypothetical protein SEVIR_7G004400v4 [Setaria viridis]|uniref:Leucine-rich repeat-containing N-terminal plant-type domain-containing protein n=2 Tax=Setaria TaxID=4554 RepID=A0A368RR12_SETIT|nr:hypothetical protein SETIT_7G021300v2 [Setaria italica]TKW03154.1 hypothetical protein SEVIR_7G004400v2 [Setaria viridis]